MNGNVAIITGSSRGIGLAIARTLALNGYSIAMNCSKDGKELFDAMETLRNDIPGVKLIGIKADVSIYSDAQYLFKETEANLGPLDLLVNNAGVELFGLFQDTSPADWQRTLNSNLISAMNCSHLAIPGFVSRKRGSIINVSSIWGQSGASCEAVYAATKGGLDSFTKSLAKELGPCGIRVNAMACGAIDTSMNSRLSAGEKESFISEIPLGRFGMPSDVAALALFLASDKASYITGQVIQIDGGY